MRDEHLDTGHQEAKPQTKLSTSNFDADEIQPLFFDLIGLDKVEAVRSILPHFTKLNSSVQKELEKLVASSGSASMAQVVCNRDGKVEISFLINSIEGTNLETFRWFLRQMDDVTKEQSRWRHGVLGVLLKSGSPEMFQECEKYLIARICTGTTEKEILRHLGEFTLSNVIEATARSPDRENFLLSLWAALAMRYPSQFSNRIHLGQAIIGVAKKTCSLILTKALLAYGAEIDFRRHSDQLTPVRWAARQSSAQAAELMKFLLYRGANPELQSGRSNLKISEEKGAKGIAKWLGMSWDELIQSIKLDRERGFCPPEYI